MATERSTRTLTKREFIRLCSMGLGGCMLGFGHVSPLVGGLQSEFAGGEPDEPGPWSKEALFVAPAGNAVRCLKCPNGCVLGSGQAGKCRNRVNVRGTVYSIAYGNPCAVHIDPIEKKPFFHFHPSTRAFSIAAAGCNLRCLNCQNWQISQVSPRETQNSDLLPDRVVDQCITTGCESIAYTYSEPTTFYEYTFDTATLARKHGIRNVLKSNGYIHEQPLRKLCRVIDAANIDLKGFDDGVYRELNGASLGPVLSTLKTLHEEGVWLEITNLVIPTWTDDLAVIRKMCEWLASNGLQSCPLHFSRFTPLYKLNRLAATPVATLDKALAIAKEAGIRYPYIGNVPGHSAENTHCQGCGTLLLERRGFVVVQTALKGGKCGSCGTAIPGVWS